MYFHFSFIHSNYNRFCLIVQVPPRPSILHLGDIFVILVAFLPQALVNF